MGFGENVGDALTFKILTLGKRPQILHRSVVRSALDPKAQNKIVKLDKPLPILEQRDKYKHPKSVFDVEEADPSLRLTAKGKSKKLKYIHELEKPKAEPIAMRTRGNQRPTATKVLANMSQVSKSSLDLTDLFKRLIVAVPAVI